MQLACGEESERDHITWPCPPLEACPPSSFYTPNRNIFLISTTRSTHLYQFSSPQPLSLSPTMDSFINKAKEFASSDRGKNMINQAEQRFGGGVSTRASDVRSRLGLVVQSRATFCVLDPR